MTGHTKSGGFTIVEVMVVLAASSMLILIAMLFINNRQAQTGFTVATRDFQTKVTDVINDVTSGVYPKNDNLKCMASGVPPAPTYSNAPAGQGTNSDCIFVGKVLQFNTSSSTMNIISVGGLRLDSSTHQEVTSLAAAKTKAIASPSSPIDLTETYTLQNGLRIVDIVSNGTHTNGAVGLVTNFLQYSGSTIQGGALSASAVIIPSTNLATPLPTAVSNISSLAPPGYPAIGICLEQGTGANVPKAVIILGASNRQLTSELHIGDAVTASEAINGGAGTGCQF